MTEPTAGETNIIKRMDALFVRVKKLSAICKNYHANLAGRDAEIARLREALSQEKIKNQALTETLQSWRSRLESVLGSGSNKSS